MKYLFVLVLTIPFAQNTFSQKDIYDREYLSKKSKFDSNLKQIEVVALRTNLSQPFSYTDLKKADIERENFAADLPYILDKTPSIVSFSDAGNGVGYTGLRLRGSDLTRINVTINGIPYNDQESHGVFLVNIPDIAGSAQSIQVQRGVGTSTNGSSAFGGSINIQTNTFIEKPSLTFSQTVGSFNTYKSSLSFSSGLLANRWTINGHGASLTSDGFIDRAKSNLSTARINTAYWDEKFSLQFQYLYGRQRTYQAWNGIAKQDIENNIRQFNPAGKIKEGLYYDDQTDNYSQDHFQLFFNHNISKRYILNINLYTTLGRGYFEEYQIDHSLSNYGINTNSISDLTRQLHLDNIFYGFTFTNNIIFDHHTMIIGGNASKYDGKHFGRVTNTFDTTLSNSILNRNYYDLAAEKTNISIYIKDEFNIGEHFSGYIDLMYKYINYTINGFRDNPDFRTQNIFNFFNPKIGFVATLPLFDVYASIAIANKEPNRDDFETITQTPRAERLYDFEGGIRFKRSRFRMNTNVYYMLYDDFLALTGGVNDVGAYTRTNINTAFRYGLESDFIVRLNKVWHINGSLALSKNIIPFHTAFVGGQIETDYKNTNIALSPEAIGNVETEYMLFKHFNFYVGGQYVSRQYLNNNSDREASLNPYFVAYTGLKYTLNLSKKNKLNIAFRIYNLLNERYEPNGYSFENNSLMTESHLYPMAGTNFSLKATLEIK